MIICIPEKLIFKVDEDFHPINVANRFKGGINLQHVVFASVGTSEKDVEDKIKYKIRNFIERFPEWPQNKIRTSDFSFTARICKVENDEFPCNGGALCSISF